MRVLAPILLFAIFVSSSRASPLSFYSQVKSYLTRDSDSKPVALAKEHCGDAYDRSVHDNDKSGFGEYIFRGDAFTDILLQGVTFLGGDAIRDRVLGAKSLEGSEFKFPKDLSLGLAIVYMVFLAVALFIFIATIVMIPACCCACWRNCFGFCCCKKCCSDRDRVRPIQEVKKWKRRFLWGSAVAGIIFFFLYSFVAIAFSAKIKWSTPGLFCQVSRVSLEVESGILYDQRSDESRWLSGLPEGAHFDGFNGVYRYLDRLNSSVVPVARAALTSAGDKIKGGALTPSSTTMTEIPNWTIPGNELYTPLAAATNNDEFRDAQSALTDSITIVDETLTETDGELNTTQTNINKAIKQSKDGVAGIEDSVYSIRDDLTQQIDNWSDIVNPVLDYSFIVPLVISAAPLLGAIFLIVMVALLDKHRKKGTEPKHIIYSRWFGCSWAWFGITGAFLLFLGISIIVGLSATSSVCLFAKDAVNDPQLLGKYTATERFQNDKDIKKAFDVCFAPAGNGDIVDAMAREELDKSRDLLEKSEKTFSTKITEVTEKFTDQQENFQLLQNTGAIVLVQIPTTASPNPNQFFLPREILFSGLHSGEVKDINFAVNPLFLPSVGVQISQNLQGIVAGYPDFVNNPMPVFDLYTEYGTGTSPPQTDVKLYSFEHHLDRMQEDAVLLSQKFKTSEPSCGALEASRFCITVDNSKLCSKSGNAEESLDNVPDDTNLAWVPPAKTITPTNLFGGLLNPCISHISGATDPEWREGVYILNSLWFGARWAKAKKNAAVAWDGTTKEARLADMGQTIAKVNSAVAEADATTREAFSQTRTLIDSAGNIVNCKGLAYALGATLDGACGGMQQDAFWIGLCWCLMAAMSVFFFVTNYKLFHYFKDRARILKKEGDNLDQRALDNVSRIKGSPSTLMAVAKQGDANEVEKQSKLIDPLTVKDQNCNTTLHCAAFSGDVATCEKLLAMNAPLEGKNDFGYTPLGVAAGEGHADVVSLLVSRGADPTVRDEFGETPLHAAARAGDLKVVEALCQECAPVPMYTNDEGEIAVDTAHNVGHYDVESFLEIKTPKNQRLTPRRAAHPFGNLPTTPETPETPDTLESS